MIVRNTVYCWLKKHRADSNLGPFDEAVHQLPTEEPASELVYEERSRQLREALARLPVEFRKILVLRDIEGWSYKELASALKLRFRDSYVPAEPSTPAAAGRDRESST
jgi:RNA polymerase sigma-70 factor (ECF subfamily)